MPPAPAKQAWADDDAADSNGTGEHQTGDANGAVVNGGKAAPSSASPNGRPPPDAEVVEGRPQSDDDKSNSGDDEDDDDGRPGCCSRCCGACCWGIGMVFRGIGWLIAYLIGFVLIIALGCLHIGFRIFHAVFNLLAQLRRADLDMVKEFDYEDESDASGTEGDEERADMEAIEDHERFQAEQQQQQQASSSSANFGSGSLAPSQGQRMGGGGGGGAYRSTSSGGSAGGGQQQPDLQQQQQQSVYVPPPKRTRDEIKEARKARRKYRDDDRRRVTAMLAGHDDPGAADGSNRPVKPPKFASCRCVAQVFIAFLGMLMVSIAFLFYSLSQVTLLGIVALLSILLPRTTIGGMQMAKEFEERNDILCKRPWVPPPPPPQEEKDA